VHYNRSSVADEVAIKCRELTGDQAEDHAGGCLVWSAQKHLPEGERDQAIPDAHGIERCDLVHARWVSMAAFQLPAHASEASNLGAFSLILGIHDHAAVEESAENPSAVQPVFFSD